MEGQGRGEDVKAEVGIEVVGVAREESVGVGVGVDVGGVGSDGEEPESREQSRDVLHMAGEGVVSDNAISDSPAPPPPPTSTATTRLTPCSWYYPATNTNVEFSFGCGEGPPTRGSSSSGRGSDASRLPVFLLIPPPPTLPRQTASTHQHRRFPILR